MARTDWEDFMAKVHVYARSAAFTGLGFVLAVLVVATALSPMAVGQKDTGGIAGIVRDPGGAVVPGAKVAVADVDRGNAVAITTNAQGE